MLSSAILEPFVTESNRIENIFETRRSDVLSHATFLKAPLTSASLGALVYDIAGALPRLQAGMDVMVGQHYPPRGGPKIAFELDLVIAKANERSPAETHQNFLWLHPFMDGNGRGGRALWLKWMVDNHWVATVERYGFLRAYYYQTLELADRNYAVSA